MGNSPSNFGETKTKTKTSVYLENVNPEESVRDGYYKNKKGVYYNGQSLNLYPRELKTFKKLKYSYAKTYKHVYYKGVVIVDADPKTFVVINRKSMPEEFKFFNSVIGMDFQNGTRTIYQFGERIKI
jgi:hypothetical protein